MLNIFISVETKRGVEFRDSTFEALAELGGKWGTEWLNTKAPSAYPAVCSIQRKANYYHY